MDGHAAQLAAAGTGDRLDFRPDALEGFAARLDHLLGGGFGGAAGRIDLARVVELDDLGVVEEARRLTREVHEQDGADGEVGRDHDPRLARRRLLAQFIEERGGKAGGADDETHAPFEGGAREDRGPGGVGEIDDDCGIVRVEGGSGLAIEGEALAGIALAEGVDEGERFGGGVGGGGERHLTAHGAAPGDDDGDAVHGDDCTRATAATTAWPENAREERRGALPLHGRGPILPPMSDRSAQAPNTPGTRRAANEQAVKLAVAGRWREAAALNRLLIERFGDDAEVYNRLAKALTELGRIREARLVYGKTLELDPANAIAQRNLKRLAQTQEETAAAEPAAQMDRGLFIEDVGKAAVVRLEASPPKALDALDAGDAVLLEVQGNTVNAVTPNGAWLGIVEPRVGLRLARLMNGGNRYAAALVSAGEQPRVIVRETYQDPSQAGKVSFPKSNISEVRAYTRRNFRREDVDDLSDEEDGLARRTAAADELPEEGWTETRVDGDDEAAALREEGDDDGLD